MTKKKKRQNPEAEDLLARPWCYYCERDFDDLKILIAHQKAKHYKCERCGRRLNTAGGLRVHMEQVHKEQLESVDNALPGRESIDLEIFGTEGIPESEVAAHNQRILAAVAQREADRRAASGQSAGNAPKRPKLDITKDLDPEEIKKKLEAHKKAMAAAASGGVGGGNAGRGRSASPGQGYDSQQAASAAFQQNPAAPAPFQQGVYPVSQAPAYPTAPVYPPQNQGSYPAPYHQPSPFQQPSGPFGRGAGPPTGPGGYNGFQPPPSLPAPPHQGFGGAGGPGGYNQFPPQGPSPPQHLPRASPSLPQPHQIPGLPPRPNAPGLPPRPNFVNAPINNGGFGRGGGGGWNQQQQMYPPSSSPPPNNGFAGAAGAYVPPPGQQQQSYNQPAYQQQQHANHNYQQPNMNGHGGRSEARTAVGGNSRGGDATTNNGTPEVIPPPTATEKKKDDKPKRETRMVYGDNEISPEEKRARLPRYEYHPPKTVEVSTSA